MVLSATRVGQTRADLVLKGYAGDVNAESIFGDYLRAADIDRDGYCDLIVSDWQDADQRGTVRLYRGSPTGLSTNASWSLNGTKPGEQLGFGIEVLDVNGDGTLDLIVSSNPGDPPNPNRPGFKVHLGDGQEFASLPAWTWNDDKRFRLRHRLFVHADVDGDGRDDLLCAGTDLGRGTNGWSCVFAFLVKTNGFSASPEWVAYGEEPDDWFGFSVAKAGDVNGDGFPDLIVGAPKSSQATPNAGRAYLLPGSKQGVSTHSVWHAEYPLNPRPGIDSAQDHHFGWAVAGVGDVNGDGFADVVISAPYADHSDIDEGILCLFPGSTHGLAQRPREILEGNRDFACLGLSLAAIGDVDGDGRADVVTAAPSLGDDQPQEGVVMILRGSRAGFERRPWWFHMSDHSNWRVGSRLVIGDFNGDGRLDIAASANSRGNSAAVFVWEITPAAARRMTGFTLEKDLPARAQEWWRWTSTGAHLAALGMAGAFGVGIAGAVFHLYRRRRLAERASRDSVDRERMRIARNLHDELGARLCRMNLLVEQVRHTMDQENVALRHTDTLSASARDLRSAMEQIVAELKTGPGTIEGLVEVISRQADELLADTGVRCLYEVPPELPSVRLPEAITAELAPAIREALANVLRHSQAREVWLKLVWDSPRLEVVVEDDGIGFHRATVRPGNGLKHFQERMTRIGGSCDIQSAPGGGTTVTFAITLPPTRGRHSLGRP